MGLKRSDHIHKGKKELEVLVHDSIILHIFLEATQLVIAQLVERLTVVYI